MNPRLEEIIGELEPDVICEDNVAAFPALPAMRRPWVRIVSCNPLEIRDPDIPPVFSGYPAGDRSGWDEFRAEYDRTHRRDLDGVQRVLPGGAAPRRSRSWSSSTPRRT